MFQKLKGSRFKVQGWKFNVQGSKFKVGSSTLNVALCTFLLCMAGSLGLSPSLQAQGEPFYKGKTIRIIVGLSAGGGYDRAARLISRYMGKYVPGNPDMILQNMPGAGSVIAANYVYGVAKPDGLTLLMPHNNIYLNQLSGQAECVLTSCIEAGQFLPQGRS